MPIRVRHRVVVDTNLWISFLLTKNHSKLDPFFANDKLILLFSQELINEFIEVARRPRFKKYFSLDDLENLLSRIRTKAEFVSITSEVNICRDIKDNFLLALAIDGKATHLLTGDTDLLILKKIKRTRIIKISEYLKG